MEQKFKVSVSVVGLKKRGRKVERHTFQAGFLPYTDLTEDLRSRAMDLAKGVVEANMKTFGEIKVNLYHVTIENDIMSMTLFSDKHLTLDVAV